MSCEPEIGAIVGICLVFIPVTLIAFWRIAVLERARDRYQAQQNIVGEE